MITLIAGIAPLLPGTLVPDLERLRRQGKAIDEITLSGIGLVRVATYLTPPVLMSNFDATAAMALPL
jgi:hypothetical protein